MQSIKFRYVFKRKSDGHIYMLIVPIEVLEDAHGEIFSMLANDLWELVSRDSFTGLTINDRDIFENDILRVYTFYCEEEPELNESSDHTVLWMGDNDYPAFDLRPLLSYEVNSLSDMICSPEYAHYEIIGNTHEHEFSSV